MRALASGACGAAAASPTSIPRDGASAPAASCGASARWPSLPPGATCGSARARTATSRPWPAGRARREQVQPDAPLRCRPAPHPRAGRRRPCPARAATREDRRHRRQHVDVSGSALRFEFRGKGGKRHAVALTDRCLARIVRRCQELPGQELFQYVDEDGVRRSVDSADVNAYLRGITGEEVAAKDFRTWGGCAPRSARWSRSSSNGSHARPLPS